MDHPCRLAVVGSVNHDVSVLLARRPGTGETVFGRRVLTAVGGKGANQARAAAWAGARPLLLARVGEDHGPAMVEELASCGVETAGVAHDPSVPSGTAVITVTDDGENAVIVVPGANAELTPQEVLEGLRGRLGAGSVVLAQAEVPTDAIGAAARAARDSGARFVLNLAPVVPLDPEVIALADPLVVNQSEAAALLGDADDGAPPTDAGALLGRARSVVLTLGAGGAAVATAQEAWTVASPRVPVVDTTGAGDAFTGVLAARLAEGCPLRRAVDDATLAGAAAVQVRGAALPPPSAETRR
ncbi:bifunctional hydroxymethylpyrimidine kinase/phosphomethylpyrimidine kinase [Phycicoccus endophyticus]|uniref:Ribokinase n=1 Tax=Phycicoccus endophyticus TaxID=1690220 RepID=A0A7G9R1I6_9MICO|nr:PfkB family carbohydrate kinase [Phycicoccus endophyticus]NHI18752.1 ribokinase [Phycicoccus endophyticus]QNN49461.1 bifunctional hydroxymethylpyrimidine kinase/phosphomethylpyrimidine kinase [Phycicoccus endophyticus]GGL36780.1 ribokinase [Phycicoccus endophyticus]